MYVHISEIEDFHVLLVLIKEPRLPPLLSSYRFRGPGSIPGTTRFSEK
jgi:hypothetical protein